ncbi:MAG: 16S rRNA (uracil(1498)-N(3))-methyltransferase [Verrucomicrobiales bacterium]|nr:16S rRNA (uracil(1498)-N(3))-methyltransferase [Verrucomicrobiales bacterium]MCP5560909.1 16S rRNA (uracil(1498)-N(3))-methyltransferase [Verrucomicrobiaceae bacterium]
MSLSRFHLPAADWSAGVLRGEEAEHAARVLRKRAGDLIEIFDGSGRVAVAEITQVEKASLSFNLQSVDQHQRSGLPVHLIAPLIKGQAFEWMLEKAVELGAASVQPVITERCVVQLDGDQAEKKLVKWRRLMLESAKQCHTPFLPELHGIMRWDKVMKGDLSGGLNYIAALDEKRRAIPHQLGPGPRPAWVRLAIGPEGDFSAEEVDQALRAGFQAITLGPLILRAETAAIAGLAVLTHEARNVEA